MRHKLIQSYVCEISIKKSIIDIKSHLCIICEENSNQILYQLSCNCCICCHSCLKIYIEVVKIRDYKYCICSLRLYICDLLKISKNEFGYIKLSDQIKRTIKEISIDNCMSCDIEINLSENMILPNNPNINMPKSHIGYIILLYDDILSNKDALNIDYFKKFFHFCCKICYQQLSKQSKLTLEKNIYCIECNSSHTIKGIQLASDFQLKNKEIFKEDNCSIF